MARQRRQPATRATTRRRASRRSSGSSTSARPRRPRRTGASSTRRRRTSSPPRRRSRPRRTSARRGGRSATRADRVVRRLGDRGLGAPLAPRQGRTHRARPSCSRRGSSGWPRRRPTSSRPGPTTFIETEGTSLKAALDVGRKYGVVRDAHLPFARRRSSTPATRKTFYALASQLKIARLLQPRPNLDDWRTWLATKGPILTRLDVDDTWMNAKTTKGELDEYKPATARRRARGRARRLHAGRFIVRNSWGTALGRQGLRLRVASLRADGVHRGLRDRGLSRRADDVQGPTLDMSARPTRQRARGGRSRVRRGTSAASFTISSR